MNQPAPEMIATARHLGAVIRVGEGNHRGHVAQHVIDAGIDFAVWDVAPPG